MRKKVLLLLLLLTTAILSFSAPANVFAAATPVNSTDALLLALANPDVNNIDVSGQLIIPVDSPNSASINSIVIPAGKTVTFLDTTANYMQINCGLENHGTIINNFHNFQTNGTFLNYGSFVNNSWFNNTGTITNSGSIRNTGTMTNDPRGTIINNGNFLNSGIWTNNGTYSGLPVVADNPVELIYNGVSTYYVTFQDAIAKINNTGYELRVRRDITIDGNVTLPIVGFTLSGAKPDGGISTLTVNNGDFNPSALVVLKDIHLAHAGTTGGNFNTFYQDIFGRYNKTDLTIKTGVTFSDIDIVGTAGSILNVEGNADMGTNSILNVSTVNIYFGGSLKVKELQTGSLNFGSGGTLDITGAGGLIVTGVLYSGGIGVNALLLPVPTDHGGTVYSAMLSNTTITGESKIKLGPTAGVSFPNSRLIYLNNTSVPDNKFLSADPKFAVVNMTFDGKPYLIAINSTNTALSCAEAPVTYGTAGFTITAAVKDGNNAAVISGLVKFYRGAGNSRSLLTNVFLNSSGNALCYVSAKDYAAVGDNLYSAVYQDSSCTYAESTGTVTVYMNPKNLGVSGATVKDKTYDGTTAAEVTGINLSGIIGGDVVSATAAAAFKDAGAGENKVIDLSDITLSGANASNYTIAPTAANIATATITPAVPVVNLTASPATGGVCGSTVSLTASISGVTSGTTPSGTVTFYSGSNELGNVACLSGVAVYEWSNVPVGTYSLTAAYSGDTNYSEATGKIDVYTVTKKGQAALVAEGVPGDTHYGDAPFTLTASGGSGEGAVSFAVKSGTSVKIDAVSGEVTIVGTGENIITVTKAGTDIYEPISIEATVNVTAKSLSISGATVKDKTYDGTTAAEVTGINLSGVVGDDVVTATATAAFKDANAGENKVVDLSDITLGGSDAGNYTIAPTAADLATTAKITPAVPIVKLSASPASGAVYGDTVSLTATITGPAGGTTPSGGIIFCMGEIELGRVSCTGGQAVYEWNNIPVGNYSFTAAYSGDANYSAATGTIEGYTVTKQDQAGLLIDGVPVDVFYGDTPFTLTVSGGNGDGAISFAVKSGTSVEVGPVSGEVTIVESGESIITVTKAGTDIYEPISAEVTVNVNPKSLSISGATVKDKEYDGTVDAEVTEINLSGIVAGDAVSASATATFKDAAPEVDKAVALSDITLSGADADKYTIVQTAADITTATITPAVPIVKLSVSPATGAVYGSTVSLTASISGVTESTTPSGTVTFYCGAAELGTVSCTGGEAVYEWNNVQIGNYDLSAAYSGDTNYNQATDTIAGYRVNKPGQADLIVDGVPADVHYGDAPFTLTVSGGSGDGAISFAVKSGTSVKMGNVSGKVIIVGTGKSIILVTKEGTDIYQTSSTEIAVNVDPKSLSVTSATVKDKVYDGTAAAKVIRINLSGIVGDDVVTAGAEAAFKDAAPGIDKPVDLSDITLSGADAGKYTIAQTAADITKATITPAIPIIKLSASPATGAIYGNKVSLTANITGVAGGTTPSGTVTFYCGSNKLGTVACTGGLTVYEWNTVPAGTFNLSAVYSGDTNYRKVTGTIGSYTIIKKEKK